MHSYFLQQVTFVILINFVTRQANYVYSNFKNKRTFTYPFIDFRSHKAYDVRFIFFTLIIGFSLVFFHITR